MTAKEFSELTGTPGNQYEKYLDNLKIDGKLDKLTTKKRNNMDVEKTTPISN
jgi:hypothetical protein